MTSIFANDATWPTSTVDLEPPERLIIWSFRRWVTGLRQNDGGHWSFVWNEFARQFGAADGKAAISGFISLIKCLQNYARRNIRYHQPCCSCLCADEICLVSLLAAVQAGRSGLSRALAEWMVEGNGIGDLLSAAGRVAAIMDRHGLSFPHRGRTDPNTTACGLAAGPATVH